MAKDQFGQDLTQQPTFKWSTSAGKIDSKSGMFTAGTTSATATITATVDQTSATVTVTNQSPTVATVASATASPVIGTTTTLSVLGADDAGEANLSYSWVATPSSGAAMPTFSVNGTNAAKQTVATFTSAGEYEFTVTITDAGGRSTSSTVNVTVSQTATTITVNPSTASVPAGQTQSFNVSSCKDQFGQAMTTVPTFDWSCSAGSIAADGTFTAPEYSLPDTITAYSGNASGSAVVTITAVTPTMALRTGDSWVTGPWGGAWRQRNDADAAPVPAFGYGDLNAQHRLRGRSDHPLCAAVNVHSRRKHDDHGPAADHQCLGQPGRYLQLDRNRHVNLDHPHHWLG